MAAPKTQDPSMDVTLNGIGVDGKIVPWAVAFPRSADEPKSAPVECNCDACRRGRMPYSAADLQTFSMTRLEGCMAEYANHPSIMAEYERRAA